MGTRDPRVDAYLERSADFAQPILRHLRDIVHAACPQVVETIKWGFPHFEHKGVLCSMASFKAHCAFGFWHREMRGDVAAGGKAGEAMGQYGRITRLSDLPRDVALKALVCKAAELNASGVKSVTAVKAGPKKPLVAPDDLAAALARNHAALATFENFSDSHKREYIAWVVAAKRQETRDRRVATAVEWMAEGKAKEWRYARP